jgi:hypothetical protein
MTQRWGGVGGTECAMKIRPQQASCPDVHFMLGGTIISFILAAVLAESFLVGTILWISLRGIACSGVAFCHGCDDDEVAAFHARHSCVIALSEWNPSKTPADKRFGVIMEACFSGDAGAVATALCGIRKVSSSEDAIRSVISGVDDLGNTPLHACAASGCSGCVKLLIEHGSDVGALNHDRKTAFDVARNSETAITILDLSSRKKW